VVRRLALAVALAACAQEGLDAPAPPGALDEAYFRCRVQPVMVKSCAFLACHGSALRPLRVYAPNGLRDGVARDRRAQPLTAAEEAANFASALALAGADGRPPLLLLKPLDEAAGGYYHRGATLYDRGDIFADAEDPGYVVLAAWIGGAVADPACVPEEAP
jgi:hypothetical protein